MTDTLRILAYTAIGATVIGTFALAWAIDELEDALDEGWAGDWPAVPNFIETEHHGERL